MIAPTPAWAASSTPSGNGKNASEANTALGIVTLLARLVDRQERGVHPRRLAGADPDRGLVARQEDRIRLDRPHGAPGKPQVAPLDVRGRAFGHDFPPGFIHHLLEAGALLRQEPAESASSPNRWPLP